MDLTEAEDIKKRGKEHTEELCKKDLHDSDNHNAVTTAEFSIFAGILSAVLSQHHLSGFEIAVTSTSFVRSDAS